MKKLSTLTLITAMSVYLMAGGINWDQIAEKAKVIKDGQPTSSQQQPEQQNAARKKEKKILKEVSPEDILINEKDLDKALVEEEMDSDYAKDRMQLKNYANVSYSQRLSKLSVIPTGEKGFEMIKKLFNIKTKEDLMDALKRYWTPKGIVVSAFYYDYIAKKPNIAENFYRKLRDGDVKVSFYINKIAVMDYLLRTKRPKSILSVASRAECLASIHYTPICLYYQGVARYILTGDNKNTDLRIAASYLKKAKDLYFMPRMIKNN